MMSQRVPSDLSKPARRVALVTGASRGIGRATALELASRGYDLCLTSNEGEPLRATCGAAKSAGAHAIAVEGDLIGLPLADALVTQTIQTFGRIDLLVNNAAWRDLVTMREMSIESWEKTLRICLTAPAFLARFVAQQMERQRSGVIINVSSVMSQRASAIAPAYVAAKGAIEALTYDLAALYGPANVRVLAICPGAIDTELGSGSVPPDEAKTAAKLREFSEQMIPLRRWGSAQEIARSIAMLASDDASYLTGTTVVVDGGWTHQLEPPDLKRLIETDEIE